MTPAALAVLADKAVEFSAIEGVRVGQAAWVALIEVDERLANRIQGTASDPFFEDDRLPMFWQAVTEAALEMDEPNDEEVA